MLGFFFFFFFRFLSPSPILSLCLTLSRSSNFRSKKPRSVLWFVVKQRLVPRASGTEAEGKGGDTGSFLAGVGE